MVVLQAEKSKNKCIICTNILYIHCYTPNKWTLCNVKNYIFMQISLCKIVYKYPHTTVPNTMLLYDTIDVQRFRVLLEVNYSRSIKV